MTNYNKLNFFTDFDFKPLFFLKSGAEIVSYLEFKNFIEKIDLESYFIWKFEEDYVDRFDTKTFLELAYTYCVFFDAFYENHEIYLKNKFWIMKRLEEVYGLNFQKMFKYNFEEKNLSKKWLDIINNFKKEEDNHQKVIMFSTLKFAFIHEYIAFVTEWLPYQIENNFDPLIKTITLHGDIDE